MAWLVIAVLTHEAVLPQHANPRSYRDLEWRIAELGRTLDRASAVSEDADLQALRDAYDILRESLDDPRLDAGWSSGLNYILLWVRLHRLEEALINYADGSQLADALAHDLGRAESSKLYRKGTTLRAELDEAVELLQARPRDDAKLRPLLVRIRLAVNDYRDRRFEALVAARQRIDQKTTTLGIVAVAVLSLSILFDASVEAVVSVAAYYLIGVGAALFTELRKDGVSDALVDVFGYGEARLRQTLLVSGIAAATGVIVVGIATKGTGQALGLVGLTTSIVATPANLLTAAAFGLAPGLLLDRVSAWTNTNISELEDTLKGETAESPSRTD